MNRSPLLGVFMTARSSHGTADVPPSPKAGEILTNEKLSLAICRGPIRGRLFVTLLVLAGRARRQVQFINEQGQNREISQSSKQIRQGAGEESKSIDRQTGSKPVSQVNRELRILESLVKHTRQSGEERRGESWYYAEGLMRK